MSKSHAPPPSYGPPPAAPPSYSQAVGGVPPSSPFTPGQQYGGFYGFPQQFQYVPGLGVTSLSAVTPGPTIVTTVVPVGPQPTHMICPHCHAEIDTSTMKQPGMIAYLSGLIIALLGCWLGCCLIPCCMDECMDVHHNCPNCKAYLGRYRR